MALLDELKLLLDADAFEKRLLTATSVFLILLCILGLLANAFVMFLIAFVNEYRKSISHWYIFQLFLSGTFFLLTAPINASTKLNRSWNHSEAACKFVQGIQYLNYYASILFLIVVSVDRYIALCHLSDAIWKLRRRTTACFISAAVWLISCSLSIPGFLYTKLRSTDPGCACVQSFPGYDEYTIGNCLSNSAGDKVEEEKCYARIQCHKREIEDMNYILDYRSYDYNTTLIDSYDYGNSTFYESIATPNGCAINQPIGWHIHVWFNFIVMFILPILVMLFCYSQICFLVFKRVKTLSNSSFSSQPATSNIAESRKVTVISISLIICFFLTWILFHVVKVGQATSSLKLERKGCEILKQVNLILIYLNSALNPFLYIFVGSSWKQKKRLLRKSIFLRSFLSQSTNATAATTRSRRLKSHTSSSNGPGRTSASALPLPETLEKDTAM